VGQHLGIRPAQEELHHEGGVVRKEKEERL